MAYHYIEDGLDYFEQVCRDTDQTLTLPKIKEIIADPDHSLKLRRLMYLPEFRKLPSATTFHRHAQGRQAYILARTPELISNFTEFEAAYPYLSAHQKRYVHKRLQTEAILREPHKYSIREWSERTGLSRSTISRLRRDSNPPLPRHYRTAKAREAILADPYADSIKNLATTYGVSEAFVSKVRHEAADSKD